MPDDLQAWPGVGEGSPGQDESIRSLRVALINLPWASFRRPSIQIGLLGALARRNGHHVELAHLNLELAARLGKPLYDLIAEHRSTSLGDWLFARAAFPDTAPPADRFLARYERLIAEMIGRVPGVTITALLEFRENGAERFLAEQIAANSWDGVDLFGLTSTFQQNTACFAMARLLKQRVPRAVIVAGGANFDGEMGAEWFDAVSALDVVVRGEGDVAFPRLLEAVSRGGGLEAVPNLLLRTPSGPSPTADASLFDALDDLPVPDYDEYFARAERTGLLTTGARRDVDLPVETSRGCWWGERRHCTFCGLNGQAMAFRSKSPERAMAEFATLARRYRSYRLFAVDNIVSMKFHRTLFPSLAEQGTSYDLFYEVKSGLPPDRLRELRAAGVVRIQPGIESLSSRVLELMKKGVRAIANVNLLRWCAMLGIEVSWNLIWGFPGETDGDYQEQIDLIPNLFHLPPPLSASRIWIERFSPLFRDRAAEAPAIVPEESLGHVYPDTIDLGRAAYFFEYDLRTDVRDRTYGRFVEVVAAWRGRHAGAERPKLSYRYSDGFLQIDDLRGHGRDGIFTYEDAEAQLYRDMAHVPRTMEQLAAGSPLEPRRLAAAIDEFCANGLAMRDGEHVLALALPHRPFAPGPSR
ncbi:RiPP maturation radical SAM protein 1 [Cereibacter changlensis]|uniref:RiPP maturation radical SAM protein 1 n=1 Tax=Cereibacter changlensis TaxID=402884 RepID=A0A4U0YVB3_9RHOB|nr:RiPP maturation radical SAM C-methyltransferase [Cereibacter changlensis]TKA94456.1 RiPP maturation radical SAM protein 1 [Cereibacter changlensis]